MREGVAGFRPNLFVTTSLSPRRFQAWLLSAPFPTASVARVVVAFTTDVPFALDLQPDWQAISRRSVGSASFMLQASTCIPRYAPAKAELTQALRPLSKASL